MSGKPSIKLFMAHRLTFIQTTPTPETSPEA